jgi:hypothetical protein
LHEHRSLRIPKSRLIFLALALASLATVDCTQELGRQRGGGGQQDEPPAVLVRFAHFATSGPVDFCVDNGSGLALVLSSRGLDDGLSYGQVAEYQPLPPASRPLVVAAGDCSNVLVRMDPLPTVGAVTAAFIGDQPAGGRIKLQVRVLRDEFDVTTGMSKARFANFFHDLPELDVGGEAFWVYQAIATHVAFAKTSTGSANGYQEVTPQNVTIVVRNSDTQENLLKGRGSLVADQSVTAFAIGAGADGKPLQALLCRDAVAKKATVLKRCLVFPAN